MTDHTLNESVAYSGVAPPRKIHTPSTRLLRQGSGNCNDGKDQGLFSFSFRNDVVMLSLLKP